MTALRRCPDCRASVGVLGRALAPSWRALGLWDRVCCVAAVRVPLRR
jgi:hypothetical protein